MITLDTIFLCLLQNHNITKPAHDVTATLYGRRFNVSMSYERCRMSVQRRSKVVCRVGKFSFILHYYYYVLLYH